MIVVGSSLEQLAQQFNIVNKSGCFDNTCLSLSLGKDAIWLKPSEKIDMLVYGESIPEDCLHNMPIGADGLIIPPHTSVLVSSDEIISMPLGYMGFIQTKGSLARLMVSVHFSDGQIDSGFKGNLTFELFNASDFSIKLRKKQKIANLYILKTSTLDYKMYSGRYNNAKGPTIQVEEK